MPAHNDRRTRPILPLPIEACAAKACIIPSAPPHTITGAFATSILKRCRSCVGYIHVAIATREIPSSKPHPCLPCASIPSCATRTRPCSHGGEPAELHGSVPSRSGQRRQLQHAFVAGGLASREETRRTGKSSKPTPASKSRRRGSRCCCRREPYCAGIARTRADHGNTGYMMTPKSLCGCSSMSSIISGTVANSRFAPSATWARLTRLFQVAPPCTSWLRST